MRFECPQYYVYQIGTREGHIASVAGWTTVGTVCPTTDANARLIAQAPALVEALRALLSWNTLMGGWDAPCWANARAVLASLRDPPCHATPQLR
jgi:hypothetical protein